MGKASPNAEMCFHEQTSLSWVFGWFLMKLSRKGTAETHSVVSAVALALDSRTRNDLQVAITRGA